MLRAHSPTIRSSALHLYYSVLPFLPTRCRLFEVYHREVVRCIRVLRGRDEDWNPCLTTLRGHSGTVTSVTFSPNGKYIATGSDDKTARIWDSTDGKHLHTFKTSAFISEMRFSKDSSSLLVCAEGWSRYNLNPPSSELHLGNGERPLSLANQPIGIQDQWVVGTKRLCKLPSAVVLSEYDTKGDTVAIGGLGGEVIILDVSGTGGAYLN